MSRPVRQRPNPYDSPEGMPRSASQGYQTRGSPEYVPLPPRSPDLGSQGSPDFSSPNAAYASLGGRALPDSQLLSPGTPGGGEGYFVRRNSEYPAPSLASRDSTIEGYSRVPTPSMPSNRNSWGSGVALASAAAGFAGDDRRGTLPTRGSSHLALGASSPRLSGSSDDFEQGHLAPGARRSGLAAESEKAPRWAGAEPSGRKLSKKWIWTAVAVGAFIVIGVAVGLAVALTRNNSSSSGSGGTNSSADQSGNNNNGTPTSSGGKATPTKSALPTSGTDGSKLYFEDGTTGTYNSQFGGSWYWDAEDPFNNNAQANEWTPPLSQEWKWGQDKVMGVNLGGWLNTEPFIVPSLYEIYANGPGGQAVDEYTLSQNMGDNLTTAMTEHYDTFIKEQDIAEIASAGLNWIRLPIAHWAVQTIDGEPYLEGVSWNYVLKCIQWCRKYGIRINLDLHTAPGSQNGWNHSGKLGSVNWLSGAMGLANAQRMLEIIRTIAEFISQPEYAPVVQMFGFINEPNGNSVGKTAVGSFYQEGYRQIREVTGIGEGKGAFLSMHDAFVGMTSWWGYLPGVDRLALDQHPYLVFGTQQTGSIQSIARMPCQYWSADTNSTAQKQGVLVAGEWSAALNDCGLWVNNVGSGARYDGSYAGYNGPTGGSCDQWNNWQNWDQDTKNDIQLFVRASMDSLQNYFFWTWKIGNSTKAANPQVNPFWHYKLGLEQGWIPTDPRTARGTCQSFGNEINEFDGIYPSAWMTGGQGAGQIAATDSASYPWPLPTFTNIDAGDMASIPQYTQTGSPVSLPGPTFTSPSNGSVLAVGNGWANAQDDRQAYTAVANCAYPSEYDSNNAAITAGMCGAGINQPTKRAIPAPTPAPR